jgi:hypothetical protein
LFSDESAGVAQQGYSIIYDLYYQLILYPEKGDQYIHSNSAMFNRKFYSCLSAVRQRALQEAQKHTDICRSYADPSERAKCEANNEGAKIFRWTNEIPPVCQGKELWSNTFTGSATIAGKQALKSVSPGQWEQIVKTQLPQWKPLFVCH